MSTTRSRMPRPRMNLCILHIIRADYELPHVMMNAIASFILTLGIYRYCHSLLVLGTVSFCRFDRVSFPLYPLPAALFPPTKRPVMEQPPISLFMLFDALLQYPLVLKWFLVVFVLIIAVSVGWRFSGTHLSLQSFFLWHHFSFICRPSSSFSSSFYPHSHLYLHFQLHTLIVTHSHSLVIEILIYVLFCYNAKVHTI